MKRLFAFLLSLILLAGCTGRPSGEAARAPEPPAPAPAQPTPGPVATTRLPGRLAYPRDGKLYILDSASGKELEIGFGFNPAWSPDGQWLAYLGSDQQKGEYRLRLVKPDGSGQVTFPTTLSAANELAWSPKEPVLAVGTEKGLWLARPDGTATALVEHPAGIRSFAWSPDGQQIAYNTTEMGKQPPPVDTLWTIPARGGARVQVRRDDVNAIYPVGWWPNQQGLFVLQMWGHSASIAADGAGLVSQPLDGSKPKQLTTILFNPRWRSWAPDGSRVLATVGGGRMAWTGKSLAVCDPQACQPLPQPQGVVDLDGVWAPTGDRIAFVRAEARPGTDNGQGWVETRALWVAAPDGSGAQEVKAAGRGIYSPQWAKDGRHLLYARNDELWWIDIAGGDPVRVARFTVTPDSGYYGQMAAPVAWYQP